MILGERPQFFLNATRQKILAQVLVGDFLGIDERWATATDLQELVTEETLRVLAILRAARLAMLLVRDHAVRRAPDLTVTDPEDAAPLPDAPRALPRRLLLTRHGLGFY